MAARARGRNMPERRQLSGWRMCLLKGNAVDNDRTSHHSRVRRINKGPPTWGLHLNWHCAPGPTAAWLRQFLSAFQYRLLALLPDADVQTKGSRQQGRQKQAGPWQYLSSIWLS